MPVGTRTSPASGLRIAAQDGGMKCDRKLTQEPIRKLEKFWNHRIGNVYLWTGPMDREKGKIGNNQQDPPDPDGIIWTFVMKKEVTVWIRRIRGPAGGFTAIGFCWSDRWTQENPGHWTQTTTEPSRDPSAPLTEESLRRSWNLVPTQLEKRERRVSASRTSCCGKHPGIKSAACRTFWTRGWAAAGSEIGSACWSGLKAQSNKGHPGATWPPFHTVWARFCRTVPSCVIPCRSRTRPELWTSFGGADVSRGKRLSGGLLSSGFGAARMALCCFFTCSTSSDSFSMQPRISSTWTDGQ